MERDLLRKCLLVLRSTRPNSSLIDELEAALQPSAKYRTDSYLVMGFDQYGGKSSVRSLGNVGLVVARGMAEQGIEVGDYDSAAVLRVLWNSKERHPFESVQREVTPRPDPGPPSCVMGKRDWEA